MLKFNFKLKLFRKRDLLFLIIFLSIILLIIHIFERSQVWLPNSIIRDYPNSYGIDYEDIDFRSIDDNRLNGWFCPSDEKALASVLFCHGNGGNISTQFSHVPILTSMNLNVFIFDYRGYGKSEGFLTERGTYLDARSAFQWLKDRTPDLPIVIHGWSLGAAIATDLAVNVEASALINECGFSSIPNVAHDRFPFLPSNILSTIRYNALSRIAKVGMPVLIIHSTEDDTVSYRHGEMLYKEAKDPKQMITLEGGHDCASISTEDYKKAIQDFLNRFLFEEKQSISLTIDG